MADGAAAGYSTEVLTFGASASVRDNAASLASFECDYMNWAEGYLMISGAFGWRLPHWHKLAKPKIKGNRSTIRVVQ